MITEEENKQNDFKLITYKKKKMKISESPI